MQQMAHPGMRKALWHMANNSGRQKEKQKDLNTSIIRLSGNWVLHGRRFTEESDTLIGKRCERQRLD